MLERTEKNSRAAQQELKSLRDRIVRLEEQKKEIAEDIKETYAEAKGRGYDTKALRQVVKREMETAAEAEKRRETEAITELYLANLGMLDGTPLGDAARERVVKAEEQDKGDDDAPPPSGEKRGIFTAEEIDEARSRGASDSREGRRIIDNPFMAGDPRRAAWDEGHCQERGSDGMDIPDSWRRKSKAVAPPEKDVQP